MSSKFRFMIVIPVLVFPLLSVAADKLKPEEIVSRHLASVGSSASREKIKAWQISGGVRSQVLAGGTGMLEGLAQLVSEGTKSSIVMKFPDNNYPGEEFTFDGEDAKVAYIQPGVRSRLGTFLFSQSQILKEGLFGGVLTTAWPLFDPALKGAKLYSEGLKKIDGRQLYQVGYSPKKRAGDVTIKLYFEPETLRHVMTVYTYVQTKPVHLSSDLAENARETESRIRLEERFDDFKDIKGLTMPTRWSVKLASEGSVSGVLAGDSVFVWDFALDTFDQTPSPSTTGQ